MIPLKIFLPRCLGRTGSKERRLTHPYQFQLKIFFSFLALKPHFEKTTAISPIFNYKGSNIYSIFIFPKAFDWSLGIPGIHSMKKTNDPFAKKHLTQMIIIFFFHYKTCSSIVTSDYVNQKSTLSKTQQTEKNSFVLISGYSSHSFCWQCIYFINTLKLTLFSSVWGHDPPCMKPLLGGRHIYEDCNIAGIRKVIVDLSRWPVSQFFWEIQQFCCRTVL